MSMREHLTNLILEVMINKNSIIDTLSLEMDIREILNRKKEQEILNSSINNLVSQIEKEREIKNESK